MHRNTESNQLCCVREITYCCKSITLPKQTNSEKEIGFVVTRGGGRGWGNWIKVVKKYKFPVIRQVSTTDIMYSMMTVVNSIWYI